MSERLICTGISKNWDFAAAALLYSLQAHSADLKADILIFHDGLDDGQKSLLGGIRPCQFAFFAMKDAPAAITVKLTEMAYSRYECFSRLHDYSQVLWLDADLMICGDLKPLFNRGKAGIAMYKHEHCNVTNSLRRDIPAFDMLAPLYNTGVMLLSQSLQKHMEIHKWLYEFTQTHAEDIASDQGAINLALQAFDIQIESLPLDYNCRPDEATPETMIMHPWGKEKFWNGCPRPQWYVYYEQFLEAGGDASDLVMPCPGTFKRMKQKVGLKYHFWKKNRRDE